LEKETFNASDVSAPSENHLPRIRVIRGAARREPYWPWFVSGLTIGALIVLYTFMDRIWPKP